MSFTISLHVLGVLVVLVSIMLVVCVSEDNRYYTIYVYIFFFNFQAYKLRASPDFWQVGSTKNAQ